MDIVGHWLDLVNIDGWIPRDQILGAEALCKIPAEYVVQHPDNANPPALFMVLRGPQVRLSWKLVNEPNNPLSRQLIQEVLEEPIPRFVPHVGYISLFPFIWKMIPAIGSQKLK